MNWARLNPHRVDITRTCIMELFQHCLGPRDPQKLFNTASELPRYSVPSGDDQVLVGKTMSIHWYQSRLRSQPRQHRHNTTQGTIDYSRRVPCCLPSPTAAVTDELAWIGDLLLMPYICRRTPVDACGGPETRNATVPCRSRHHLVEMLQEHSSRNQT